MSNELPKLPESDAEAVFNKLVQGSAVPSETLANVPEKYRKFFTMALAAQSRKSETGKMDLTKNARPEELEFLKKANIPLNEVPADIAKSLEQYGFYPDEESQLAAMKNKKPLDVSSIKEVSLEEVDDKTKKEVLDMLEKFKANQGVPIIDTSKLPLPGQTGKATQPVNSPADPNQFFSQLKEKPAEVQQPPSATPAAPLPPPAPAASSTMTPTPPVNNICKCCSWDNNNEYPVNPDKEDITNRLISIASATQGGDGRFRKTYRLFGGRLEVSFREILNSEGRQIYLCEQGKVAAGNDQSEAAQLGRLFSLDRIQNRRFCCGVEKIVRPGFSVVIPPLSEWIKQHNGDADKALDELENYVRDKGFVAESNLLAAVQKWLGFEQLVIKLWRDQSFYNGSL